MTYSEGLVGQAVPPAPQSSIAATKCGVDARGADESAVHRRRAQPAFFRSLDGVAPLDAGAAADRGEARNGPRIQAVPGQPGGGHHPSRSRVRGRNHGDAKDRRLRGAVPHSGGAAQRRVASPTFSHTASRCGTATLPAVSRPPVCGPVPGISTHVRGCDTVSKEASARVPGPGGTPAGTSARATSPHANSCEKWRLVSGGWG